LFTGVPHGPQLEENRENYSHWAIADGDSERTMGRIKEKLTDDFFMISKRDNGPTKFSKQQNIEGRSFWKKKGDGDLVFGSRENEISKKRRGK